MGSPDFWKAVKKVLPNKSITPQQSASLEPVTVDGKTTTDALTIVKLMVSAHTSQMLWRNCFLAPLNWNQLSTEACLTNSNSSQSFISLKPGSATFVHCQLRLLKTSNGTGLDGILPCLLKDVATSISASLTAIINLAISSTVLPEEWKKNTL